MARRRSVPSISSSSGKEDVRLAKQDAWNALVIWIVLEALSLFVLYNYDSHLIGGTHKLTVWLSLSLPLGAVGACLIGLSSWLMKHVQEQVDRSHPNKRLMLFASQAVGWVGLMGIGLPSILVGLTLWSFVTKGA
jgi:Kef-type K+ transport system membrane component KefB